MNWNKVSLFKMPGSYRRYNLQPRYYDERKENLKDKLEREAKIADTVSEREIKFQTQLEEKWGNSDRKSQVLRSNIRLLVILILICGGVFYVFKAMDSAEDAINNVIESNK